MSIIIASLDYENQSVHIGSDRKQTTMLGEPVKEELQKLLKIRSGVYFCMNGHVGNGQALVSLLNQRANASIVDLVAIISDFKPNRGMVYGKLQGDCVFVLVGVDDEGPFIYCRFTENEANYFMRADPEKVLRVIAAPCDETALQVSSKFYSYLISGVDHKKAIADSIQYASEIDETIGSNYDWVTVRYEQQTLESNIAATGTLAVGNASGNNNAGITGVVEGDNVRFWAGAPYAQRGVAPWRVLDNGNMYATAGYIGGFNILENSLESADSYAGGKFVLYPNDGYIAFVNNSVGYWAGIGANIFPATAGVRGVARFENTGFSGADNYGAVITAKNGQNNYSLLLTGNIRCMENTAIESMQVKTQVVNGSYTVTTEGAIIVIDNNANITLPANPSNGRTVSINRTHTAVLRISGGTKGVMLRDVYTAPGALTENVWGGTFTYSSTLGYWVLTGFLP